MRDCSKGRRGFDRVLMAVAATFLTVSATSALAGQSIRPAPAPQNSRSMPQSRVPNPRTSRPRPPAISRPIPPRRCPMPQERQRRTDHGRNHPIRSRPQTAPSARPAAPQDDAPRTTPRPPRRHACDRNGRDTRRRAGQGRKQRPAGRSAGRRQAARHAWRQVAALFRPQERARRGRKVLQRARIRAAVDPSRQTDRQRQGRRSRA